MATDPPADLVLAPVQGRAHSVSEWLTTFHLVTVVLDPYTNESAWLLETAGRILRVFDEADCRVSFLVTATADEAREFLGPWAKEILTFADPERTYVKAVGLGRLPALVHLGIDGRVVSACEGWDPGEWAEATETLARQMSWKAPLVPAPGDPSPFAGSPAV